MSVRRLAILALAVGSLASSARAAEAYRQSVGFQWDRTTIDVIVAPPGPGQVYNDGGVMPAGAADAHPLQNSYLRAAERGIALWPAAVTAFGASWLRDAFRLNVYVLGRDPIPAEATTSAEIVVTFDVTTGPILGTSIPTRPCVVAVAKAFHVSFTANDMTNLVAHEVGHCLGQAHLDGPWPRDDLMQAVYQHPDGLQSSPVHCPSNLNVATLERVFAAAAGRTPAGGTASVDDGAYRQPEAC